MTESRFRRYYLAFVFTPEFHLWPMLHCTHAYFGARGKATMGGITYEVDQLFKRYGTMRMPTVRFHEEATFHDNTRVLVASDARAFEPFRDLRTGFAERNLISTRWPFRPHVTTPDLNELQVPFTHYVLFKSGHPIRSWPIFPEVRT